MKNIEDCLERLDRLCSIHPYNPPPGYRHPTSQMSEWDYKFVSDVSTHTTNGSALSTKQADTLIKILRNNIQLFDKADRPLVQSIVDNPSYRHPLFQAVNIIREVRWAGGSTVLFRFPYNAAILVDIRSIENAIDDIMNPVMLKDLRAWKVIVDVSNYKHVMNLIQRHNFAFDDETLTFFMNIANNVDKPNVMRVDGDEISVEINNDVMAALWLENMEWLKNV